MTHPTAAIPNFLYQMVVARGAAFFPIRDTRSFIRDAVLNSTRVDFIIGCNTGGDAGIVCVVERRASVVREVQQQGLVRRLLADLGSHLEHVLGHTACIRGIGRILENALQADHCGGPG